MIIVLDFVQVSNPQAGMAPSSGYHGGSKKIEIPTCMVITVL